MKLNSARRACAAAASSLLMGGLLTPAHADSFQGSFWSITYEEMVLPEVVDDPLNETWRIWVHAGLTFYEGSATYLDQIAFKVSSAVVSVREDFGPPGWYSVQSGDLSSDGCGDGEGGFVCLDHTMLVNGGKGVPVRLPDSPYRNLRWRFDVTVPNGSLLTDSGGFIKARLLDENGNPSGDLISGPVFLRMIPSVPEPESYAMMLAGLGLILGAAARRRQGKSGAAVALPGLPDSGRSQLPAF